MTKEVCFASPGDKIRKRSSSAYLVTQWGRDSWSLHFFCPPSSTLAKCMSMSGAVCMPGSSAVCTSNYHRVLFYPFLAHQTHYQFWVTVISLDGRDDPDASSHPTSHVTCFRQHKMPYEPVSLFSSRKLFLGTCFTHSTLSPSESVRSASVLTWVDERESSPSVMFLQHILLVPNKNHSFKWW